MGESAVYAEPAADCQPAVALLDRGLGCSRVGPSVRIGINSTIPDCPHPVLSFNPEVRLAMNPALVVSGKPRLLRRIGGDPGAPDHRPGGQSGTVCEGHVSGPDFLDRRVQLQVHTALVQLFLGETGQLRVEVWQDARGDIDEGDLMSPGCMLAYRREARFRKTSNSPATSTPVKLVPTMVKCSNSWRNSGSSLWSACSRRRMARSRRAMASATPLTCRAF